MTTKIDNTDRKILEILKADAKCSARAIAQKIKLPATTVYNRIRRLENEGIIQKYTVVLDQKKLGMRLIAYALLHYDMTVWGKEATRKVLQKRLLALPNVEEVKYIVGRYDILLKLRLKDMDDLNNILLNKLRNIPGIGRTETFLVLNDVL